MAASLFFSFFAASLMEAWMYLRTLGKTSTSLSASVEMAKMHSLRVFLRDNKCLIKAANSFSSAKFAFFAASSSGRRTLIASKRVATEYLEPSKKRFL